MNPTFSWDQISQFITNLKEDFDRQKQEEREKPQGSLEPIIQKWTASTKLFTRGDLGGLLLDEEDAAKYRACARALHSMAAGKTGQISRGAVEDAFQTAILRSLNISNIDPEPEFSTRLAREIDELKRTLKRKPEVFVVHLEVQGLNREQLPRRFGSFTFFVTGEYTISSPDVREEISNPDRLKQLESHRIFREKLRTNIAGKLFAEIELEAFDRDAAVSLAENKLRKTLDILNYFGKFFSDADARVFLPGEAMPARRITIVGRKAEAGSNQFAFENTGPIVPFSFPANNSPVKSVQAFERASCLLDRANLSDLEKRLVSALQWAGRACTDDRNDSAFLHSCISLETLLSNRQQGEITFAFSLRAVHLIFRPGVRMEWLKKMKKYYQLRSDLAHKGTALVSDEDVATINELARHAIFTALVNEPFSKMTRCDELDSWFEEQLLAGTASESRSIGLQSDVPDAGENSACGQGTIFEGKPE